MLKFVFVFEGLLSPFELHINNYNFEFVVRYFIKTSILLAKFYRIADLLWFINTIFDRLSVQLFLLGQFIQYLSQSFDYKI